MLCTSRFHALFYDIQAPLLFTSAPALLSHFTRLILPLFSF